MAERRNLDRVKQPLGSQPVFHDEATVDALGAMVIALLGEVMVMRDRLDANERLSARRGGDGPADVDRYLPDPAVAAERARYRDAAYDRVLGAARDRLMPAALREQQKAYDQVIADVSGH
jgi:hypothetical protein